MQTVRGRRVVQLGYICADPRAAATRWAERLGAGPFFWFEMFRFENWTFEGRPVDTPIDVAMGFCGDLNVEFICPRASHPTVYGALPPPEAPTLHHIAIMSDDWNGDAARLADLPLLATANTAGGSRFCYRDTRDLLGVHLELIEAGEDVNALFGAIRAASDKWDGAEIFATL